MERRTFLKSSILPSLAMMLPLSVKASDGRKIDKNTVKEPAKDIPIIHETDICVLGGSPTGVFAAVRAARLGAKVAIIEKNNHFGGVASITCTWHKLMSDDDTQQIIAGLTAEVTDRLDKQDAVNIIKHNKSKGFEFRPGNFKIILDQLIREEKIKAYLHTSFCSPVVEDGVISAVIVENKSGRCAIKAKQFIDATGDGDLCARLELPQYKYEHMLPPTTCAFFDAWGSMRGFDLGDAMRKHGKEFGYDPNFIWGSKMPHSDVFMLAGTRVNGVDCSVADDLTHAEIEGRRQVDAIVQIMKKYYPEKKITLQDFPVSIGIRDTRHIKAQYKITTDDILYGKKFDDAIANGSYRVDVHHQEKPGITLKYLDGTQTYNVPGMPREQSRWREETATNPTFYQIPLRSLIPGTYSNLIYAGRMIDSEIEAFGAIRVQVNTNQMGEAAGVASYLALLGNKSIMDVNAEEVRKTLSAGGSLII